MGEEQPLQLYGLDDFPLSGLEIVDGTLDMEKLKSGKYIIEGLEIDDYGNVDLTSSAYKVGDRIQTTIDGRTYEYEVLASVRSPGATVRDIGLALLFTFPRRVTNRWCRTLW